MITFFFKRKKERKLYKFTHNIRRHLLVKHVAFETRNTTQSMKRKRRDDHDVASSGGLLNPTAAHGFRRHTCKREKKNRNLILDHDPCGQDIGPK